LAEAETQASHESSRTGHAPQHNLVKLRYLNGVEKEGKQNRVKMEESRRKVE
jgi:hypothetical protein